MTALVSFERVFEVLDLEPLVAGQPDAVAVPAGPTAVEFDDVHFPYPAADEVSLASLESVARPDVAPVRDDGAARRRRSGRARADGRPRRPVGCRQDDDHRPGVPALRRHRRVDLGRRGRRPRRRRWTSLHDAIGVVTQDAHMFHDTIRANLQYARPGATDEELARGAARRADRSTWSRRCPTGSTPWWATAATGCPAARSSGWPSPGCCSRRPTSSCSTRPPRTSTARARRPCSGRWPPRCAGRTSLVIAHRLSTIREADQILVVDDGRIVAAGAPRGAARRGRPVRRPLPHPVRPAGAAAPAPDAKPGQTLRRTPPSTGSRAPVMYDAAGESRNVAARPSSSGSP